MYRFLVFIMFISCTSKNEISKENPYVMILGVAQDAGYPQINCKKKCCESAWKNINFHKMTSCIAIVDPIKRKQWIIDATPDIKNQLQLLKSKTGMDQIDGVLLTHAHIGHYTGLIHFGREVMGSKNTPVFVMPRMKSFLEKNGPWSQLVELENITLFKLKSDSIINLNRNVKITPILVPHRDEFSETIGYKISINKKSLLFIPDIDKWEKWDKDIIDLIEEVDYAFLDGTFYKNGELNRDMSEIPHPFIEESMGLLSTLSMKDKRKVNFIHFNHTNPLLIEGSLAQKEVLSKGFNFAEEGAIISF